MYPQLWLAEQMTLFPPHGMSEPLTLPFSTGSASRPGRGAGDGPVQPGTPEPKADTAQLDHLSDSIALVTALLPGAGGETDVVTALLADQDPDRLLGISATTAWLAAYLVRQFDELHQGAGTAWLQGLALGLVEEP